MVAAHIVIVAQVPLSAHGIRVPVDVQQSVIVDGCRQGWQGLGAARISYLDARNRQMPRAMS